MAKPDLSSYSVEGLTELENEIRIERTRREQKRREEARAKIEEIAREYDVSVGELVNGERTAAKKTKSSKAVTPPKYRNPANSAETWSGRGRQPGWYKEALAEGIEPESMAI